jgi:hypothetical protein
VGSLALPPNCRNRCGRTIMSEALFTKRSTRRKAMVHIIAEPKTTCEVLLLATSRPHDDKRIECQVCSFYILPKLFIFVYCFFMGFEPTPTEICNPAILDKKKQGSERNAIYGFPHLVVHIPFRRRRSDDGVKILKGLALRDSLHQQRLSN